MNIHRL